MFQVKRNLQAIFDQEGWTLDTSVTLKSNLDVFPYEEVFSAVSKLSILPHNYIIHMYI